MTAPDHLLMPLPSGGVGLRVTATTLGIYERQLRRHRWRFWRKSWANIALAEKKHLPKVGETVTLEQYGREYRVRVDGEPVLTWVRQL